MPIYRLSIIFFDNIAHPYSGLNLKVCSPELGSAVAFVAPVEVVHAFHGEIAVSKAKGGLRKFSIIFKSLNGPNSYKKDVWGRSVVQK